MYSSNFSQQVAIVTGAGQGIGFEIANQLCKNGASVILNDIDEALAKSGAAKISQNGNCIAMAGDAADIQFIETMTNAAVAEFGKLTIAIANAGITLF